MEKATLLVLAGGASRRMGRSKALLPFGGRTIIEHLIANLAPAFAEILVSANAPLLGGRYPLVRDLHPGAGAYWSSLTLDRARSTISRSPGKLSSRAASSSGIHTASAISWSWSASDPER